MRRFPFDKEISYNAGCWVGSDFYFSASNFNGLFKKDSVTGTICFLTIFTGDDPFMFNLHRDAYLWGHKIVFVPFQSENISVYDTQSEEIEIIHIHDRKPMVMGSVLRGDILWLFCGYEEAFFIKYDLKNKELVEKISLLSLFNMNVRNIEIKKWVISNTVFVCGNEICGIIHNTTYVFIFNTDSNKCYFVKVPTIAKSLSSICYSDGCIFFSVLNDYNIYKYDINFQNVTIFSFDNVKNNIILDKEHKYCLFVKHNGKVYAVPSEGNAIIKIEKETLHVIEANIGAKTPIGDLRKEWKRFLKYEVIDNKIVIFPYRDGIEAIIDVTDDTVSTHLTSYDDSINIIFENYYQEKYIEKYKNQPIVNETFLYNLKDFIERL